MKDEKIPLKVYDASAGSGKTFRLVLEYLTLVLRKENSATFDQIVAMTFTNKAAYEMKERIIDALKELAYDISSSKTASILSSELGLKHNELQMKAKEVLLSILHNYEDFNVLTIDKFNLRLIKSFSKDLDLPSDFEIIMNEEELIEKIVDRLLERLGKEGNEHIDKIVFNYAEQNLDEEDKWNFRRDLIEFGTILKREKDLDKIHEIMNMDLSMDSFRELKSVRNQIDKGFRNIQKRLQDILSKHPLDSERIKYKTATTNAINKISTASFPTDKCLSDRLRQYCEEDNVDPTIFPKETREILVELDNYWNQHEKQYAALSLYFKNFFNMCLLKYIAEEIEVSRIDERKIRISEFNQLISRLIRDEKAIFIYERLGTRFHHFLLDEFQDTSHLQWMNLVPLLHESLGWNYENLIVGDPKQSIYRFKNGVAEQFVALPGIYNPKNDGDLAQESAYFQSRGIKEPLKVNWRSAKNIVEFNNTFFENLRDNMPAHTRSFYSSISQDPNSKSPGSIQIVSMPDEQIKNEDLLPHIINAITDAQNNGHTLGDICILGETNNQCNVWARGLAAEKIKVVSADSLLIDSSIFVQLAVAYFKVMLHRQDQHQMKHFAELYFRSVKPEQTNSYFNYIVHLPEKSRKRLFDTTRFIADEFESEEIFFPSFENLYQLALHFFNLVSVKELEDPYMHRFADFVHQFELKNGPDLNAFLEEYELRKKNLALEIPESSDAIQIMTIHKSKGLEFPVVIIPSMAFNKTRISEQMVKIGDFMIYKKPSGNEKFDEIRSVYNEEIDQVFTDCVNKCYVSMTRPIDRLYIFNYFKKSTFGSDFHETLRNISNCKIENEFITYNDITKVETKSPEIEEEFYAPKSFHDFLWFPEIALQDKSELYAEDYFSEQQIFGRQFHSLISRITSSDQIQETLNNCIQDGLINAEYKDRLEQLLYSTFQNEAYLALFLNANEVLYEQDILVDTLTNLRPDLIIVKSNETLIVDYKTGSKKAKDVKQVSQYIEVLKDMGYPQVQGFLFYTEDLALQKIDY